MASGNPIPENFIIMARNKPNHLGHITKRMRLSSPDSPDGLPHNPAPPLSYSFPG
jgi:hypothetical protein